ncbi:unnamed protein product [Leptidea sinapis]|uniref:Uncharacterized protein n=1 Tax=Leptidea sinapis TaxID=189913 RepID=A0A5E4QLE1_9NEOP|nr:unnamed protein product [Leptidea sinapis]
MAERLRKIAQQVKDKIHISQLNASSREKVDQLLTKYVPANKVSEIAEKFKHESITTKVKELVSKYEKFTGIEEIMAIQNTVVEAQLIIQERAIRSLFSEAEREERELFATMSAAVKLGHERERAHAERNKYWHSAGYSGFDHKQQTQDGGV